MFTILGSDHHKVGASLCFKIPLKNDSKNSKNKFNIQKVATLETLQYINNEITEEGRHITAKGRHTSKLIPTKNAQKNTFGTRKKQ